MLKDSAPADAIFRTIGRQRWLRFGIRDRLIRAYCNSDQPQRETSFVADFYGFKYPGRLNSFVDWSVYFYGAYEREYLSLLARLIGTRRDAVFLDVGANVGHHSLFMSRFCAWVHAFEPNPEVRTSLEEKIRVNHTTNIVVHGVGLGVDDCDLPFYMPIGSNKGTGSFVPGFSSNNESAPVQLPVVNGDRYVAELGLERLDLIKIDVEGFEKDVLRGLPKTLTRFRPVVAMEYSTATKGTFSNEADFFSIFPDGYQARRIVSNSPLLTLFNRPTARLKQGKFDDFLGDVIVFPGFPSNSY